MDSAVDGTKTPAEVKSALRHLGLIVPPMLGNMSTDSPPPTSMARRLGPTGALGLAWTLLPISSGILMLWYIGPISEWLTNDRTAGFLLYTSVFVLGAGFGVLPTYSQSILGGWVFGIAFGLPAALIGFAGGSLIGYLIARRVSREAVGEIMSRNIRARVVRDALVGRGFWRTLLIVTLIRIPPNSPFALTNLVMASAGVRLVPYLLGTLLGMTPRTAIAVIFAAAAAANAEDIQEFVKEGPGPVIFVVGLVSMFIALGVIGYIANRALERMTQITEESLESDDHDTASPPSP